MSPELAAYKAELAQVALPFRLGGLAIVLVGAVVLIASRYAAMPALMTVGFVLLGLGWGLAGYAVWLRTQWARKNPFKGPR
jgi:hypothetical protein